VLGKLRGVGCLPLGVAVIAAMRTAALSLGVQKIAKEKIRRGLFP